MRVMIYFYTPKHEDQYANHYDRARTKKMGEKGVLQWTNGGRTAVGSG